MVAFLKWRDSPCSTPERRSIDIYRRQYRWLIFNPRWSCHLLHTLSWKCHSCKKRMSHVMSIIVYLEIPDYLQTHRKQPHSSCSVGSLAPRSTTAQAWPWRLNAPVVGSFQNQLLIVADSCWKLGSSSGYKQLTASGHTPRGNICGGLWARTASHLGQNDQSTVEVDLIHVIYGWLTCLRASEPIYLAILF